MASAQDDAAAAFSPAKLTDRFLAYLLDVVPFFAAYYASLYAAVSLGHAPNEARLWRQAAGVWIALYILYQILGNLSGATLGKRLFGLRVAALDGGRLNFWRSVLRAFGYFLSTPLFNLGFLWSLFHPRSRAWHDLLSGSVVVEAGPRRPAAAAASAVCALVALAGIFACGWASLARRSPADEAALRRAREGLRLLAALEEANRDARGRYTDRLSDLADVGGDIGAFKKAIGELLDPEAFRLSVTRGGYRIQARAKDSRRSVVEISGPPAAR